MLVLFLLWYACLGPSSVFYNATHSIGAYLRRRACRISVKSLCSSPPFSVRHPCVFAHVFSAFYFVNFQ